MYVVDYIHKLMQVRMHLYHPEFRKTELRTLEIRIQILSRSINTTKGKPTILESGEITLTDEEGMR